MTFASTTRQDFIAYIAPIAVFMLLTTAEGLETLRPYYPVVYTLKTIAVAATWFAFRSHFPRFTTRGFGAGIAFGVAGIVIWIAGAAVPIPGWISDALGSRTAYNPLEEIDRPALAWAFLVVRFLGLVAVVPLIEEVFWRGFLLRYLIDDDFQNVPIGRLTGFSFAAVTIAFAATHPEIWAALAWGAGINLLCRHTGNLWACIVAHAVTNLLLGIYVVSAGAWHLW